MSVDEARRLPQRASLDQLRKQAKELKASHGISHLSAAQHRLSQSYGFENWSKLKLGVEKQTLRRLIHSGEAGPVEALLRNNPNLASLAFDEGDTPLHMAAEANQPTIVELLVRFGAKTGAKYISSAHTPLSWALTCPSFDSANKLVELGVEPDLFCAAGLGDLERVKAYWTDGRLRMNASKSGSSRRTSNGDRLPSPPENPLDQIGDALYFACRADRFDVAEFLLEKGADPNFRGFMGGTCLHWAEFSQNSSLCCLLRAKGGADELLDYQFKASPKDFPAMAYAGLGFEDRLANLLAQNPSILGIATENGTLLHAAAWKGHGCIAQILLNAGLDKTIKNQVGKTALDVAQERGNAGFAALLF